MRGEFIRGDGLVLPNNITNKGAEVLLRFALQNAGDNVNGVSMLFRLGNGVYSPNLPENQLDEPTQLVGGYEQQGLSRSVESWPTIGNVNGDYYAESKPVIFTAVGPGFNKAVSRCWLANLAGWPLALSSPFPAPLLITPTTPAAQRTFRYRLYLR